VASGDGVDGRHSRYRRLKPAVYKVLSYAGQVADISDVHTEGVCNTPLQNTFSPQRHKGRKEYTKKNEVLITHKTIQNIISSLCESFVSFVPLWSKKAIGNRHYITGCCTQRPYGKAIGNRHYKQPIGDWHYNENKKK